MKSLDWSFEWAGAELNSIELGPLPVAGEPVTGLAASRVALKIGMNPVCVSSMSV